MLCLGKIALYLEDTFFLFCLTIKYIKCNSVCLSVYVSILTPLKLLQVQASNLARLITTPAVNHYDVTTKNNFFRISIT